MFSNNAISSSWTNPQQNQQQQPNTFGQPTGFGTTGFGSSAFGQPQQQQQQQQQQPQANPMFGNLGGTSTTTPAPAAGFGAFGPANTSNTGGSLFGQPKPATGFGAFGGGTSTFGSTGAFGNNNAGTSSTGTGLFGSQPSTSTSGAFGGGGLFGEAKPATTAFGATSATNGENVAPITTGTGNTPYSVYNEKDGTSNLQYQTITCMPPYRGTSLEELRFQDYQQGRKTAGTFGQTSFGAPSQPNTGIFGQSAAQNPTPAANPMFGNFGNTNNATTAPSTGFGAFGQPNNGQPAAGSGAFGSFGQQQQQQTQPSTGFGAFGQPQQNTGTGLFGQGNAFSANNNNQAKPFGAFGPTPATNTFGSSTGAFGQPQNQQQSTTGNSIFGQPQQQQQQQQQTNSNPFGAFGANNALKPSIFGTTPMQPSTGFGAQQNQSQQQQGTQQPSLFGGGSLFGANNQQQQQQQQPGQQQQPAPSLFGQSSQQPATGSLFGTGAGGSLFGAQNQQQQQQQQMQQPQSNGFNLFGGAKPAAPVTNTAPTGGLFSGGFGQPANNATTTTQPSSFFTTPIGQQNNNNQNSSAFGGGSMFTKPIAPLGTAPSTGQNNGLGTSFFGNTLGASMNNMNTSTLGQNNQGTLTASIAQPIASNLPIFSMLPPGPRAISLEQQPKKKTSYFVDVPTRSPVPRLGLSYAPANAKLRGYASTNGSAGNLEGSIFANSKPNALSLNKPANKSVLGPEPLLSGGGPSPSLGSGGRKSVKKLILDRKVEPSDLFSKSSMHGKVTFSPALSVAAREKEAAALAITQGMASPGPRAPESPSPAPQSHALRISARAESPTPEEGEKDIDDLQEGDYWMRPDLATLKKAGHEELVSVTELVVGRKGYGQITFLDPVDLTNVPKLSGLLGELVRFDDKECSVYPDSDEAEKPPPGQGLNVRARIELVRCWAQDKATREPIKDEKHPLAVRHLKRLKNMKNTHFESFDLEEGRWVFTVDHF